MSNPVQAHQPHDRDTVHFYTARVLLPENCRVIIDSCKSHLAPATVVVQGQPDPCIDDSYRRAQMCHPDKIEGFALKLILGNLRTAIANVTGLPIENQEKFQYCKYEPGDFFDWHLDSLGRVWSFVTYLNSGYEGGETEFISGQVFEGDEGVALGWKNDGGRTKHRAAPVTSGEKHVLLTWVRNEPPP